MAHNIARIAGTDQAWYADKPAWHGLGTVTPGARTAKQLTKAVPAFRQPIELAPVAARIGGRWVEDPAKRATHRRGDPTILGYVSPDYGVGSDSDALEVMEAIVNAARRAAFVTGGLLGKGERGFASIDLSRVVDLRIKRDPSRQETHLFGTWAHDGEGSMKFGLWQNRVECQNMLNAALGSAERNGLLARIVHRGDMTAQLQEAQRVLGFAEKVAKAHVAEMNRLAETPINRKWMKGLVEYLVPIPEEMERKGSREEARDLLLGLYAKSPTLVGVPESAYRAYQAVVEYADHHRPLRIGGTTPTAVAADRRFRSITEGPAADMKSQALAVVRHADTDIDAAIALATRN